MTTAEAMNQAAKSAVPKAVWRDALTTTLPSSTRAKNLVLDSEALAMGSGAGRPELALTSCTPENRGSTGEQSLSLAPGMRGYHTSLREAGALLTDTKVLAANSTCGSEEGPSVTSMRRNLSLLSLSLFFLSLKVLIDLASILHVGLSQALQTTIMQILRRHRFATPRTLLETLRPRHTPGVQAGLAPQEQKSTEELHPQRR
ncbi:uncharacterized protein LOC123352922 [Mauremys mutica]|uniref:uncharacterized protein LOC123352922 n=1 Tax=Mauremys mutica TaxID=74926 RepID=UPI001D16C7FF|nr:uncharacterized protein LOC123352922 [Mauremys mutica]